MRYTNVKHQNNQGTWIDSETFSGQMVDISAAQPKTVVGGIQVVFGKSKIRVSKPRTVRSCDTDCTVGTVQESVEISVNTVDSTSFDALFAELQRVLATDNTKAALQHGIIPPAYESFDGK